jgi:hypothetical protein
MAKETKNLYATGITRIAETAALPTSPCSTWLNLSLSLKAQRDWMELFRRKLPWTVPGQGQPDGCTSRRALGLAVLQPKCGV